MHNPLQHVRPAFMTDMRSLGGGETSLLNLLSALCTSGIRPVLICPEGDLSRSARLLDLDLYEIEFPNIHLRLNFVPTFSISFILKISKIITNHRANVIHVESLLALYYGGIVSFFKGIPLVATYHGYWPLSSPINKLFLFLVCKRIYPVSRSMEAELANFKIAPTRTKTIPLGVNSAFLEPLPSKEEARRALGIPLDTNIVLQVARFQDIKGHHILLEALALLACNPHSDMPTLLVVGGVLEPPSQEILAYRARIEHRASMSDLQRHVKFLGHRQDVPLIMRAADILVVPSIFESFGMVVIEAMTVGVIVIATNAGGPAEIITDGETGLLVPSGDPLALAAAITYALEHHDQSARMVQAAQSAAHQLYGQFGRCHALIEEYQQLNI